jgi:hypothetical protein
MSALILLAVFGVGALLADMFEMTPNNFTTTPYALFASFWAAFLIHFWRRSAAHQSVKWGSLDIEEKLEPPRKEFHGEKRINPVTDKPELHYPWYDRIGAYIKSTCWLTLSMVFLLALQLALFYFRHKVHKEYDNPNAPLYFQLLNAIVVEIANWLFSDFAVSLTDDENHRTQREYMTHRLAKNVTFKFFNSYVSLYWIAFFKGHDNFMGKMRCRNNDCLLDLGSQLACFMFVRIVLSNLVEAIAPKVSYACQTYLEERQMKNLVRGSQAHGGIFMYAGMSSMEVQAKRETPDTYSEMEETLFHYGYCILFVSAAPWMPLVILFAFVIETTLDKTKFYKLYRRPSPLLVPNNEPWDTAFDIMSIFGMLTNIAIVVFATDAFEEYSMTEKLTWFFLMENGIIAVRILVGTLFPARPTYVDNLVMKHRVIAQKHLDCVETSLDVQPFIDPSSGVSKKVVIADRDEGDDEEEDDL